MQILRAGYVRFGVLQLAPRRIAELEAAIEQSEVLAFEL